MLHFDNPTIHLRRPVIVTSVAQALGVKPFEILAELIPMQVFVAPHQGLDDSTVFRLGKLIGVDFRIDGDEDEDGGSSPVHTRPIDPASPPPLAKATPMTQALDRDEWKSIRFEGVDLPQSLMGISILINIDDFTERTGDWIWKLPHCKSIWKGGPARWCHESATEIIDHMIEHRETVLAMIRERLVPNGFDPDATFSEWISSLMTIREISSKKEGDCQWIAGNPDPEVGRMAERFLRYLDSVDRNRRNE